MYILPGALAPLDNYRQFILVLLLPGVGKTIKHPYNWRNLKRHGAHDPSIWLSCTEAAHIAASTPVPAGAIGWCVGFVITKADPIICLDIDGCVTPDGQWTPEALELMRRFPAAYEVSISNRGAHGWAFAPNPPDHGCRNERLNIELYTEVRFICLGHAASGTMYDVSALLPEFIRDYFPYVEVGDGGEGWTTAPCEGYTHIDDDELLRRAMSQTRKGDAGDIFASKPTMAAFADLWTRNVQVLQHVYPPDEGKEFGASNADAALAKELAYWTGKNCERIEHLMNQSALKRDKWETRRRDTTYLRQSILKGVAYCKAAYYVKPLVMPSATPVGLKLGPKAIDHNTFIARADFAVIFAGCVYIQDHNSILLPNGDIVDQARFNAKFAGYSFVMDNEGQKTSKSAWDGFLGNQLVYFPRVEGTEFNPRLEFQDVIERGGRQWVNTYKPPVIDRRPGDTKPFMDLLNKLLPNGDDALILLSYMAAIVQNPGVKFRWAPFVQGTRGNGKSTLIECLKHALGHKYIFTLKTGMIENGFNAWLENNVLYIADDIYSVRDRTDMMEALKSLITGRDQSITLKGIDSIQKRIVGNFVFTDNHKDAMRKQDDTRDICSLYCAQQSRADRMRDGLTKQFFSNFFYPWLEGGGYAYIAEMLHTMQIDERYNPAGECQEAPETSVTREAVVDGRTGVEHEIEEWIVMGEPGFCGDFVSHHMLKAKLKDTNQRALSPLKAKEVMNRLGYEVHRALPDGRVPIYVQPDNYKPVLYVKRDSTPAEIMDPASVTALYVSAQQAAVTERNMRIMMPQGV
jgi:hypothetical protein